MTDDAPDKPVNGDVRDEAGRFAPGHMPPAETLFQDGNDGGTAFKPEHIEQVEKLAKMGATVNEIADFFGVTPRAIYYWRHTQDGFADALNAGRVRKAERTAMTLYQRANGYDYVEQQAIKIKIGANLEKVEVIDVVKHQPAEFNSMAFVLTNMDPENWKHRRTNDNLNVTVNLTADQARAELADFYRDVQDGGTLIGAPIEESQGPEIDP